MKIVKMSLVLFGFLCVKVQASDAPPTHREAIDQGGFSYVQPDQAMIQRLAIEAEKKSRIAQEVERQRYILRRQEADAEIDRISQLVRAQEKAERDERERVANDPHNQLYDIFSVVQKNIKDHGEYKKGIRSHVMADDFLPYYESPPAQIMEDNAFIADADMPYNEIHDKGHGYYMFATLNPDVIKRINPRIKLTQQQWNAIRIKVARLYHDPYHGLFAPSLSCKDRCSNMSTFTECYAARICPDCDEKDSVCVAICVKLPLSIPALVVSPFELVAKITEAPCAASYVCCDAECARKCYRNRYENNVLEAVGVRRK